MKVLIVCLGNICRSPIAQGVLQAKLVKSGRKGKVDSAGVIGFHQGEPPDHRAIQIASEYAVDISNQQARQFRSSDFDDFDLILTMDRDVQDAILSRATWQEHREKVKLFLAYAGAFDRIDVPDPYYGDREGFRKVFELIDLACEKILAKWS